MNRLTVYSPTRRPLGILQNAFNIHENVKLNSISSFSFSLPADDTKNHLCQPFNTVNYANGQVYRIMPKEETVDELGTVRYECEHVIATLLDHLMFGWHVMGGIGAANNTTNVIRWLLARQSMTFDPWAFPAVWRADNTKRTDWVLGTCEINRNFEYGWEQEQILHALWSIGNPFTEDWMFDFNTNIYPYVLNLRRLSTDVRTALPIMIGRNLVKLVRNSDPTTMCTRIYPLGQGEGINQVNIRRVNNNIPFIQSSPNIVEEYGIIERPFIDRRYTDEQSLRDAATALLRALEHPYEEWEINFAALDASQRFRPSLGRMVTLPDFNYNTYIVGIEYNHDEEQVINVTLANQSRDIVGSIANAKDRQRIEMAYAQGATTFFTESENGNCDFNNPLRMELFIPPGLNIINFIELDVFMGRFRIDSQATEGGGSRSDTSGASSRNTSGPSSTTTSGPSSATSSGASSATTSGASSTATSGASSVDTTTGGGVVSGGASTSTTTSSGGATTSSSSSTATTVSSPAIAGTWILAGGAVPDSITATTLSATTNVSGTATASTTISPTSHSHMISAYPRMPAHTHGMAHTHTIGNHTHNMEHTHLGGNHSHGMSHTHNMSHTHGMAHTHNIAHNHNMAHTHDMSHTHSIVLPSHSHTMVPNMAAWREQPTRFDVIVNGQLRQTITSTRLNRDITDWLLNAQGRLSRGTYHRIEIRPNLPSNIRVMAAVKGFVNSRGDRAL